MRKCFTRLFVPRSLILAFASLIVLSITAAGQEPDGLLERVAPFWRIGAGFETRLMINNTQAAPRNVRLDVYDADGRRIPARDLTLAPLESIELDLSDLTGGRAGFGQIALRHDGRPLEVAAHVMVMHSARGLVFDEHSQLRSQFLGSKLIGTSDLGVFPAASLLVVANTSGERRKVTIHAVAARHRGSASLTLGPRQTELTPLARLFREPEADELRRTDTAIAIEVEHDGDRGEVLVQGLLMGSHGMAANQVTDGRLVVLGAIDSIANTVSVIDIEMPEKNISFLCWKPVLFPAPVWRPWLHLTQ